MSAVEDRVVQSRRIANTPPLSPFPSAIPRQAGTLAYGLRRVLSLQDLEPAARRRLPRFLFGFISGGVETNASLAANRQAFSEWHFRPRVLVDTTMRSQSVALFDRHYAAPFGIAPMGGIALAAFEGDLQLARAAAAAGIPFILSGASLVPLETVIAANPAAWFQAYIPSDRARIGALIDRVGRAGFETLVVTVDVPVSANRENNVRNGWALPLRPSARLAFDSLSHPRWLFGTVLATLRKTGMPHFENMTASRGAPVLSVTAERDYGARDGLSWADISWIRDRWQGRLLIKGVLAARDARIARDVGLDGIIVSNHGGRQLDFSAASLAMLAAAKAEAGEMAVLLDSGVRRGTDVLKALALGAAFVFLGRPFLYGAVIAGEAGVHHAISLLSEEIDRDLALLGCGSLAELGPDFLVPAGTMPREAALRRT